MLVRRNFISIFPNQVMHFTKVKMHPLFVHSWLGAEIASRQTERCIFRVCGFGCTPFLFMEEKRMKRILALLLALCLVLCLAACGNEDTTSDITSDVSQTQSTTDTSSKNESTASSTESGTETSTSTPTNSETPSTTSKPTESSTPTTSTTSKPTETSKPTTSTTTKPTETHTHDWGWWKTETKALVGKDGTEARTCSGCKEVERRSTTKDALRNSFFNEYLQGSYS